MQLVAAITGDLREILADELKRVGSAVEAAITEVADGLKKDWAENIMSADLGNLSKAVRRKVKRDNADPLKTTGLVYVRGYHARQALWAFETGAVVRPGAGRQYLTVPTHFNRRSGRKGAKVLFTPAEIKRQRIPTVVLTGPSGKKMLFARVARAQMMSKGSVRDYAYVAGTKHRLGSGRRKRTAEILKYGSVPLFTLLTEVRLSKRLNLASRTERWRAELPRAILRHMERLDHGQQA